MRHYPQIPRYPIRSRSSSVVFGELLVYPDLHGGPPLRASDELYVFLAFFSFHGDLLIEYIRFEFVYHIDPDPHVQIHHLHPTCYDLDVLPDHRTDTAIHHVADHDICNHGVRFIQEGEYRVQPLQLVFQNEDLGIGIVEDLNDWE